MKKVCIITSGTRGDIQPLLLFAKYLKDSANGNWQPTFVTVQNYEEWIRENEIDFAPISTRKTDVDAELTREDVREALVSGNLGKLMKILKESDADHEDNFEAIEKACQDADILISNSVFFTKTAIIAEKLGKPVGVWLSFPDHATREFVHPMMPWDDSPFWNNISHKLMNFFLWKHHEPVMKKYRKQFGLPPIRSQRAYRDWFHRFPAFNAFSPIIVPPCPKWKNVTTGGFVVDNSKSETSADLSPELLSYVSKKQDPSPVIYLGFGSMPVVASPTFHRFIVDLYKELSIQGKSYRFLVFTGQCTPYSKPLSMNLPTKSGSADANACTFFPISSAPHNALFPLCDFILHHGGAGTTAAALYSGTPSASIPVCCDQAFWAKRTRKIMNIPMKSTWMTFQTMTPKKMIDLIEVGLTRRTEAQQIAQKLQTQEDGLASALEWLKQIESLSDHS